MTTIDPDSDVITLINVFDVDPDRCDELVGLLAGGISETFSGLDGFVSATVHRSLDGTRVVNYAQWASRDAFEAVRDDPDAQSHQQRVAAVADAATPIVVSVVHTTAR